MTSRPAVHSMSFHYFTTADDCLLQRDPTIPSTWPPAVPRINRRMQPTHGEGQQPVRLPAQPIERDRMCPCLSMTVPIFASPSSSQISEALLQQKQLGPPFAPREPVHASRGGLTEGCPFARCTTQMIQHCTRPFDPDQPEPLGKTFRFQKNQEKKLQILCVPCTGYILSVSRSTRKSNRSTALRPNSFPPKRHLAVVV